MKTVLPLIMITTSFAAIPSAFAGVPSTPKDDVPSRDFGSLCHVAAADSCEADKARADIVCDGKTDAAAINAAIAQMAAARDGAFHYSWGFFRVKDISFGLPGNDKAIAVVDGRFASEMSCEGVQISTDAPFDDDSRVNPKCIGIRTCCGGNNGRRYALEFCKLMGLGTAFHIAAEHLIMRQCAAQRCAYGYVFGDVDFLEPFTTHSGNHPVTMENCCFEYCWYGITLGRSRNRNPEYVNVLTAIDLNAEEDDGYDAYTAWKSRKLIQDLSDGYWQGEISYFLTAKAKGHVPSERNLWGKNLVEGADFRTINTAARRRGPTAERPTSRTDLGFGYFDTDLNRMVWRTETGWSE